MRDARSSQWQKDAERLATETGGVVSIHEKEKVAVIRVGSADRHATVGFSKSEFDGWDGDLADAKERIWRKTNDFFR